MKKNKRVKIVLFRVTEEEYKQMMRQKGKYETLSEFIRKKIFGEGKGKWYKIMKGGEK
jgi:hypothetical protein